MERIHTRKQTEQINAFIPDAAKKARRVVDDLSVFDKEKTRAVYNATFHQEMNAACRKAGLRV